ncbi:MAG: hypothetical protein V9E81_06700 [Marmoricola sp.]
MPATVAVKALATEANLSKAVLKKLANLLAFFIEVGAVHIVVAPELQRRELFEKLVIDLGVDEEAQFGADVPMKGTPDQLHHSQTRSDANEEVDPLGRPRFSGNRLGQDRGGLGGEEGRQDRQDRVDHDANSAQRHRPGGDREGQPHDGPEGCPPLASR